ncbi:MAG: hypothetical protein U0271_15765 [Polyangiaceae bacterium]
MSKVIANGFAVATTTTGHIAHVEPPGDPRKVAFKDPPVPLWNQVPSARIFSAYPGNTQFESGNIWVEGTLVGPKSDPMDTWPTPKGAINSWATSFESSGSKNVYVEKRRVYRFTDKTWQNEKNSLGKIDDAAGTAAAKAAFDQSVKDNAPVIDKDSKSGSDGKATGKDGKADGSEDKTKKGADNATSDKCELLSVVMVDDTKEIVNGFDKAGKRVLKDKRAMDGDPGGESGRIQVVMGSTLTLTAKTGKLCADHKPKWKMPEGGEQSGLEIKYTASRWGGTLGASTGSQNKIIAALLGGAKGGEGGAGAVFKLADAQPDAKVIVCETCGPKFNRKIEVFPSDVRSWSLEPKGFELFKEPLGSFLGGKLGVEGKIEVLAPAIKVEGGWGEEEDWQAAYALSCTGGGNVFKGTLTVKYTFFDAPFPAIKAAKLIVEAINWVYEKLKGGKLIDTYIKLTVELAVSFNVKVTGKKKYGGSLAWDSTSIELAGTITVTLAIGVGLLTNKDGDGLVSGEASGSFAASLKGAATWDSDGFSITPSVTIGPIMLNFKFQWNLLILIPNDAPQITTTGSWWSQIKQKVSNQAGSFLKDVLIKELDAGMKLICGFGLSGNYSYQIEVMKAETKEFAKFRPFSP